METVMTNPVLAIIGGSGLYDLPGLTDARWERVASPWGEPSDNLQRGRIGQTEIVFLPRHGRGHRIPPHQINYRANIDALKRCGATHLVSVSAVGSYKAELYPGLFVLPDQYADRTWGRDSTFFEDGIACHVPFAHPVSPLLQDLVLAAAQAEEIDCRRDGTLAVMNGPQFSSRAESLMYKAFGFDLIGMTAMPEAKLAREAELPYATIAMVTDFDCWHPEHDAVTVEAVVAVAHANADKARRLVARLARDFPQEPDRCPSGAETALDGAIMTAPAARNPVALARLDAVARRLKLG
jgi:5'-methylthioadenosine phosphorylase